MNFTEAISQLASAFRQALEEHLSTNNVSINTDFFGDPTSKFPKGCCKGSALIFGQYLIDSYGRQNVEYVCGGHRDFGSHGWTELNDHIVDLTADQFGSQLAKVIVSGTQASEFHMTIEGQRRFPCSIPDVGTFRDVLNAVTTKLADDPKIKALRKVLKVKIAKQENLYTKYSKNLELVSRIFLPDAQQNLVGKYICPLCLKTFSIDDLDRKSKNHLTEEHVPPQSVGWKRKLLTCKSCNNTQGSQFDSQVLLLLKTQAFNRKIPGASVYGTLNIGPNVATGVATINPDGSTRVAIIKEKTNPKSYEDIKARLEKNIKDEITISWKTGDLKRALISMIRAAYLWGFSEFGYAFIFNQHFKQMREQIMNPESDIFFERQVLVGEFSKAWEGINIVSEPFEMRSYAFMMNLTGFGVTDRICVLLPGADDEGLNRLGTLRNLISAERPDLSFHDASDLAALHNEEHCFDIYAIWFGDEEENE